MKYLIHLAAAYVPLMPCAEQNGTIDEKMDNVQSGWKLREIFFVPLFAHFNDGNRKQRTV